ncbi:hypothetical protein D3Z60_04070 [Lachnospiraceae bacterium]|nr:hypothetical protein [Lachnospiraceae bacterium]
MRSLVSLVRNSVVLAVYLLFSVACFFTVHEHLSVIAPESHFLIFQKIFPESFPSNSMVISASSDALPLSITPDSKMWWAVLIFNANISIKHLMQRKI